MKLEGKQISQKVIKRIEIDQTYPDEEESASCQISDDKFLSILMKLEFIFHNISSNKNCHEKSILL